MTDQSDEWMKRNKKLAREMECYCDNYRMRKCSSCNAVEKAKRKCREYPSGRTYCEPMMTLRTRKFKDTVLQEVKSLIKIESEPQRLVKASEQYVAM